MSNFWMPADTPIIFRQPTKVLKCDVCQITGEGTRLATIDDIDTPHELDDGYYLMKECFHIVRVETEKKEEAE